MNLGILIWYEKMQSIPDFYLLHVIRTNDVATSPW